MNKITRKPRKFNEMIRQVLPNNISYIEFKKLYERMIRRWNSK